MPDANAPIPAVPAIVPFNVTLPVPLFVIFAFILMPYPTSPVAVPFNVTLPVIVIVPPIEMPTPRPRPRPYYIN